MHCQRRARAACSSSGGSDPCLQDHAADVSSLGGVQHHPLRSSEMEQQPEDSRGNKLISRAGSVLPMDLESVEERRMLSKSLSITDNVSAPAGQSSFS